MAKYSDGVTIAEVGDIVKCVEPTRIMCLSLNGDFTCRVLKTNDSYINVEGIGSMLYADRFELIKRTGAAPVPEPEQPAVKHEQSPPLVVWLEEERITLDTDLHRGEFFVYMDDPHQVQCLLSYGGEHFRTIVHGTSAVNGHVYKLEGTKVRRVKQTIKPQFTVI